jgi:CTP:molybdopterin cytidylyltransferase MocA
VVTGSDSARVEKELKSTKAIFVYNEQFEEGMLSSVQKGIAALGAESAGFLILLGDQPMVAEKVINRLIALFQKTTKGLLVPTFLGKRGHPVLIDTRYREEIGKLSQAIGLRELFLNHPEDVLEMEVATDEILKDIDTPEDYRREIED